MDAVFRALADPTRRSLLDELFTEDGQTLTALESRLPMTRIGVMKHLRVLEEARLVTTKRRGREKLHFLNPVPIRLVHDRWVSKYTEPWVATLTGLKKTLEEKTMEKVFEIYIKTTPERLWEAITDPELRQRYSFGLRVESDWTEGSPYSSVHSQAPGALAEGENLEVDPPRRLVQSFTALWSEDVKSEGTSRVTWEIEPVEDSCRLVVTHDELREGANDELYGGWPMILSGLKTLLETGEDLTTPGSLRYAGSEGIATQPQAPKRASGGMSTFCAKQAQKVDEPPAIGGRPLIAAVFRAPGATAETTASQAPSPEARAQRAAAGARCAAPTDGRTPCIRRSTRSTRWPDGRSARLSADTSAGAAAAPGLCQPEAGRARAAGRGRTRPAAPARRGAGVAAPRGAGRRR